MSRFCLWITRHWPFNAIGWSHKAYLWFLGKASDALVKEIYGSIPLSRD